jgi:hypothetical protein
MINPEKFLKKMSVEIHSNSGVLANFILMEGFGREFPKPYKEILKKWLIENTSTTAENLKKAVEF